MNINNLDLEIKPYLERLIKIINKKILGKKWSIEATFFEDGDLRIEFKNAYKRKKSCYVHCFEYLKFKNKVTYIKYKVITAEKMRIIKEQIITGD